MTMSLSNYSSAKIKLEQFYLEFLLSEGDTLLDALLEEFQKTQICSEKSPDFLLKAPEGFSNGASNLFRSPKKRTQSEMLYEDPNNSAAIATTCSKSTVRKSSEEKESNSILSISDDLQEISSSRRRSNFDVIPKFYFKGIKMTRHALLDRNNEDQLSRRLPEIESYFKQYPSGIPIEKFVHITKKLCGLPSFFNLPFCKVINDVSGGNESSPQGGKSPTLSLNQKTNRLSSGGNTVQLHTFLDYWQKEVEPYSRVERFFRVIKQRDADHICKDDFVPFMKELLHFHPGLEFLSAHDEFKRKYALTVITRIFYKVNLSRTGRISVRELRASNLFTEFIHVDEEIDINKVTEYFSYEHFYVLYCRFFELDADKDGKLGRDDLAKYGDYSLSDAILDRIYQVGMRAFSDGLDDGFGRSVRAQLQGRRPSAGGSSPLTLPGMTIPDFIYFMLAEEDKTTPAAILFWFNCCDMDGDGKLTYPDMWHFYQAQIDRVAAMGQDVAGFRDVMCQMIDYINPIDPLAITLEDMLKPEKKQSSGLLFDVLFNLNKFMRFEMRDPFQEKLRRDDGFGSDWNRFAYYEYIKLASEEECGNESVAESVDSDAMAVGYSAGMEMDRQTDGKDYSGQGGYGGYGYGERGAKSFGQRSGTSAGMYSDDEDDGPEIEDDGFDGSIKDGTQLAAGAEAKPYSPSQIYRAAYPEFDSKDATGVEFDSGIK